jgi:hypothetical protein
MKRLFVILFVILAVAAPAIAAERDVESARLAPQHCIPIYPDFGFCFVHLYEVDAYSDFTGAIVNFNLLSPAQKRSAFLLTTNDQTRRALIVYKRLAGEAPHPRGRDGFVTELFETVAQAQRRYELLEQDQRAGAFILTPREDIHEALLVYRTFGKDGAK